jgi:hypothetical protein
MTIIVTFKGLIKTLLLGGHYRDFREDCVHYYDLITN